MRRSEREITQREKLLELLDKCRVMHLGLTDGAAPYVVPLHFGWEEKEGESSSTSTQRPRGGRWIASGGTLPALSRSQAIRG